MQNQTAGVRPSRAHLIVAVAACLLAGNANTQTLQWVSPPPTFGNFLSAQFTNWPPLPWVPDWLGSNVDVYWTGTNNSYVYDDSSYDYSTGARSAQNASGDPPTPPGGDGPDPGVPPPGPFSYGPSDTYLTITVDTNQIAQPVLHVGVTNDFIWELLHKFDLKPPNDIKNWTPVEFQTNTIGTNEIWFTPFPATFEHDFFRAVGGSTVVGIALDNSFPVAKEPCNPEGDPIAGRFTLTLSPSLPFPLTVAYFIGGSASNGIDYTNISDTVIVPMDTSIFQLPFVTPYWDTNVEFSETVKIKLLPNGYVLDPEHFAATLWIDECTNPIVIVATNVPYPAGIDYHPPKQCLLLGVNLDLNDHDIVSPNFALLNTNHFLTNWSGVKGIREERKLLTIKATANGFTNGDVLFNTDNYGEMGWLSADGAVSNLSWCVLTNEPDLLEGSLWLDQTGIWGNQLLAVSGYGYSTGGTRGVWRIPSPTNTIQITRLVAQHLEGLLTLSNDSNLAPWNGQLLTADEDESIIYALSTRGFATPFHLGMEADKLLLIPTNQDLYVVFYNDDNKDRGMILKLPRLFLAGYAGDILAEQAGELLTGASPYIFIIHWDATQNDFVLRRLGLPDGLAGHGHFEGVTFAPIDITPIPPVDP